MYIPTKRMYADGGQMPQEQNPEMQIVQQIMQAIQQLSPEAQQMLMQGLGQMQQTSQQDPAMQEQQMSEDQYMPPQQRMGGMQNKGFRMLPKRVQEKIMRNS